MTDQQIWMNIEQAAVTLGLSVRTVNRHINAGKLQSRLAEGRREVLMDGPVAKRFRARSRQSGASIGRLPWGSCFNTY